MNLNVTETGPDDDDGKEDSASGVQLPTTPEDSDPPEKPKRG